MLVQDSFPFALHEHDTLLSVAMRAKKYGMTLQQHQGLVHCVPESGGDAHEIEAHVGLLSKLATSMECSEAPFVPAYGHRLRQIVTALKVALS